LRAAIVLSHYVNWSVAPQQRVRPKHEINSFINALPQFQGVPPDTKDASPELDFAGFVTPSG
jgi:hypothetical protein